MIYLRPVLYPRGTILSPLARLRFRSRIKNFFHQRRKGFIALTRNYDFKHIPQTVEVDRLENNIGIDLVLKYLFSIFFPEKEEYIERGIVLFIFLFIIRNLIKDMIVVMRNEKRKYKEGYIIIREKFDSLEIVYFH